MCFKVSNLIAHILTKFTISKYLQYLLIYKFIFCLHINMSYIHIFLIIHYHKKAVITHSVECAILHIESYEL